MSDEAPMQDLNSAVLPAAIGPLKAAFGDIFRGTMGGISVTFVGHPFDTDLKGVYKGSSMYCAKSIWYHEGITGYYKGVTSPLAGQMFFQAMKFMAYGQSLTLVKHLHGTTSLDGFGYFQAGALAYALGAMIESPVDFFKTQIQVQLNRVRENRHSKDYTPQFMGVSDAARVIVRQNGLIGAYQGVSMTILRNVLAGGSYLASFELMRLARADHHGCSVKEVPIFDTFMCGGISGLFYWIPFYPIDVVKSSLMADSHHKSLRRYQGAADAVRKMYAEGGVKAFYKGFMPCILRSFPANAALLVTVFQLQNLGIPF